jgi:hypothetical protein
MALAVSRRRPLTDRRTPHDAFPEEEPAMKRLLGVLVVYCTVAASNGSDASNLPISADAEGGGTVVKLGGLSSKTPASWKEEKPATAMRVNQFKLAKADGDIEDAELIIFFFEGGAGSAADNVIRWQGMFVPPAGKTIDDVSKIEKFKVGSASVTYLDVKGMFNSKNPPNDPKAKTEKKTDFRRFGVIFEVPSGQYFLTLTGPARTLEQHKKSFDEWLKNFK